MIDPARIAELNAPQEAALRADLESLETSLERTTSVTPSALIDALVDFSVAAPSWAVGTGGTRFGRFPLGGEPSTTEEKIDDVATLNVLTASNGSISLHVPWDDPDDPDGLRQYAAECSIEFDAMNSNTFQDNPATTRDGAITYKFGSLANADPAVREAAVEHNLNVIDLGVEARVAYRRHRLAGGRDQPPRPGGPPDPVRARRRRPPADPRPSPRRMAHVHRAQAVRAGLLCDGQPRLGFVAPAGAGGR